MIKNCPALKTGYGQIGKDKVKKIVRDAQFMEIWKIKKNDIDVCKSCEFRFICTDCRAFHQSDVNYLKPAKCTYDPEIGEWG